MTQFDVKIKGTKKLQRRFNRLARKIRNKTPLYKRIGIQLLNEISHTFETETHEGRPWKPLKLSTIMARRKGKGKGTPKILQDTGTLRRSFVREVKKDYVKIHIDPGKKTIKDGVVVGTPIEYAPYHEFGGAKGRPPRRPMLPSMNRALQMSVQISDKYIDEQLRRVGLK